MCADQLFACTNCHVKVGFDQLSSQQQLCKDCRKLFPLAACGYCKTEFHCLSVGDSSETCKKCQADCKQYGEPKRCSYCTQKCAFQGHICLRCRNSERKYGSPIFCEECKLKCAFSRPQIQKDKVNGRTLCSLCTVDYRRARYQEERHLETERSVSKRLKATPTKFSSKNSSTESVSIATDHLIEMEKYREQIVTLKRQISEKERIILEKDKQIGELQGQLWQKERETRTKLQQIQKEHSNEVETLKGTIKSLRRQNDSSNTSKPSKKS